MAGGKAVARSTWLKPKPATTDDPLAIECFDYLEIYTECARQTAYYLSHAFGFTPIAYRGFETSWRESVSYVLRQGDIHFIVTGPLQMTSTIASAVLVHGLTTHDVAFRVPNCEAFYYEVMSRGAISVEPPTAWEDRHGVIHRAAIRTYGDTIHSIIERRDYGGAFLPGFVSYAEIFPGSVAEAEAGLRSLDHVVGNVELGRMNEWVSFYEKILGFSQFQHFSDRDISTEYSALMSKVMASGEGKIKLPINEPAEGKRKSQIQEYLDFHNGPGVQHVAMATDNIIATVDLLRKRGARFLRVPQSYYDEVPNRVGTINEDLKELARLGILVDRDEDGYLLQLFTKPLHDRPTLFFEVIQREGSRGFGIGNFKALFEAIERDQAARGNL